MKNFDKAKKSLQSRSVPLKTCRDTMMRSKYPSWSAAQHADSNVSFLFGSVSSAANDSLISLASLEDNSKISSHHIDVNRSILYNYSIDSNFLFNYTDTASGRIYTAPTVYATLGSDTYPLSRCESLESLISSYPDGVVIIGEMDGSIEDRIFSQSNLAWSTDKLILTKSEDVYTSVDGDTGFYVIYNNQVINGYVELINDDTSEKFRAELFDNGLFYLGRLPAGTYSVSSPLLQDDVELVFFLSNVFVNWKTEVNVLRRERATKRYSLTNSPYIQYQSENFDTSQASTERWITNGNAWLLDDNGNLLTNVIGGCFEPHSPYFYVLVGVEGGSRVYVYANYEVIPSNFKVDDITPAMTIVYADIDYIEGDYIQVQALQDKAYSNIEITKVWMKVYHVETENTFYLNKDGTREESRKAAIRSYDATKKLSWELLADLPGTYQITLSGMTESGEQVLAKKSITIGAMHPLGTIDLGYSFTMIGYDEEAGLIAVTPEGNLAQIMVANHNYYIDFENYQIYTLCPFNEIEIE